MKQSPDQKEIRAANVPVAGPYSQAVEAGDYVFVSGQLPLDPATGMVVPGGIREQTEMLFTNLANVLAAGGLGLGSVVRTEVFLKDIKDFTVFNEVYASKFVFPVKPARFVIQAADLPKGVAVEVSCIAFRR